MGTSIMHVDGNRTNAWELQGPLEFRIQKDDELIPDVAQLELSAWPIQ